MSVRNVCVLGGTGFVGHHLVSELAREGYQVRVLTRRRERHRDLLVLPTVELIDADIYNLNALRKYLKGQEVVINLVGILNERGDKGKGFRHAHPDLAQKIAHACHDCGVQRVLHMSALNADAKNGVSHYLVSKGEAEDLLHATPELQVTSFRPSIIVGPGDSFFNRFAALLKMTPILPLACANTRFAPVYVGDVVEVIRRSITDTRTHGQRYELCGPKTYTLKQLVEYTAQIIGGYHKVVGLGRSLSWLQANIFEYLPGKPFSRDNYRSLQKDSVCAKAFPLGITPTPIEAVVPAYLINAVARDRYHTLRAHVRHEQPPV